MMPDLRFATVTIGPLPADMIERMAADLISYNATTEQDAIRDCRIRRQGASRATKGAAMTAPQLVALFCLAGALALRIFAGAI